MASQHGSHFKRRSQHFSSASVLRGAGPLTVTNEHERRGVGIPDSDISMGPTRTAGVRSRRTATGGVLPPHWFGATRWGEVNLGIRLSSGSDRLTPGVVFTVGIAVHADRTASRQPQESQPPTRFGLMSATLVMPEPFHGPLGELLARTYDVCAFSCSFTPRGRLAVLKLVLFRVSCRGGTRST